MLGCIGLFLHGMQHKQRYLYGRPLVILHNDKCLIRRLRTIIHAGGIWQAPGRKFLLPACAWRVSLLGGALTYPRRRGTPCIRSGSRSGRGRPACR